MPIKKSEVKNIPNEDVDDLEEDIEMSEDEDVDLEDVDEVELEDLEEESAAAKTLKANSMPVGPANKSSSLSKVITKLAGMDKETINKFVASMDWVNDAADGVDSGASASNKSTIKAKPSNAVAEEVELDEVVRSVIAEDIATLFEGEDLKEEFKEKLSVIVESAINLKVSQRTAELEEEYEEALLNEVTEIKDALVDNLDALLDSVIDNWLDENEVGITTSIKADLSEQFIEDLRTLFETHYITVPEDRVDVVEELTNRIEELEESLNAQLAENVELEKTIEEKDFQIEESLISDKLEELSEGLSETDKERFFNLVENTEYTDLEEFTKKAEILKESIHTDKSNNKSATKVLFEEDEVIEGDAEKGADKLTGPMAHYVEAISRSIV